MITMSTARVTATRIQSQRGWTETSECRRCGITFNTRHRAKADQTHCRDCKPYEQEPRQ